MYTAAKYAIILASSVFNAIAVLGLAVLILTNPPL